MLLEGWQRLYLRRMYPDRVTKNCHDARRCADSEWRMEGRQLLTSGVYGWLKRYELRWDLLPADRLDQTLWAIKRGDWLARVAEPIGVMESGEIVDAVAEAIPPRRPPREWTFSPPVFSTPACTLRELVNEDATPLFEMMADPAVAALLPPAPPTVQGFEQFIEWTQQQREAGRSIVLGVVPPGLQHAVGFFQLHSVAPQFATAEWGFVLASQYWGTGLFRSGAELIIKR